VTAADIVPRLLAAGLIEGDDIRVTPLTGGVSSDIVLVESAKGKIVVKAALEKLRVKDDWFADVSRNRVEQHYFEYAARVVPESVPRILGGGDGWFAMEFLGNDLSNWKSELLAGTIEIEHAELAGEVLGRLHAASWNDPVARDRFATLPNFHALRIEPYLLTTASRVPEAADFLRAEAVRLAKTQLALVHGDFSPKNLLVGPNRLVVLDAECGWFGDPAFDTAFLLTHLHLKALLHPQAVQLVSPFWSAYTKACGHDLETNTVRLLLGLLLARVHGKSPVEYLSEEQRAFVTRFVLAHLPHPPSLSALTASWK
jgi:aminoglycoside phosphotransferase (APT) family kinase protein